MCDVNYKQVQDALLLDVGRGGIKRGLKHEWKRDWGEEAILPGLSVSVLSAVFQRITMNMLNMSQIKISSSLAVGNLHPDPTQQLLFACTMWAVYCTLCTVNCVLCTVHCALSTVHCALSTVSTVQCAQYTVGVIKVSNNMTVS